MLRNSQCAFFIVTAIVSLTTTIGCAGRAELWPNADNRLRKTATEFAADAAKRHPYKVDAERGGQALARAEVGYIIDRVDIINLSDTEWTNVEVWINGTHVIFLPAMEAKTIKKLPFQAIYNDQGQSFPTSNGAFLKREPVMITKVELYRDGKLFDVPVTAAE